MKDAWVAFQSSNDLKDLHFGFAQFFNGLQIFTDSAYQGTMCLFRADSHSTTSFFCMDLKVWLKHKSLFFFLCYILFQLEDSLCCHHGQRQSQMTMHSTSQIFGTWVWHQNIPCSFTSPWSSRQEVKIPKTFCNPNYLQWGCSRYMVGTHYKEQNWHAIHYSEAK